MKASISISEPIVERIIVDALFGEKIWSNNEIFILFFGRINLDINLLNSDYIALLVL